MLDTGCFFHRTDGLQPASAIPGNQQVSLTPMNTNQAQGSIEVILAVAKPALRPLRERLHRLNVSLHPGSATVMWPEQNIASYGVGQK
jgi:hypothetical protein